MSAPAYVFVPLSSRLPTLRAPRGDGPPTLTKGGPQYETIQRPKRVAVTQYTGTDPIGLDLPILFDGMSGGYGTDTPVEDKIAALFSLWNVTGEPIQMRVNANGIGGMPVDTTNLTFIIEGIDFGTSYVQWDYVGNRLARFRADFTVHLLQYTDPSLLTVGGTGAGTGNAHGFATAMGARHKTHRVKAKETLPSIAIDEYGDRTKWHAIGAAQTPPISDPRNVTVGQVLRLP